MSPRTIASEMNRKATHNLAGKLMVFFDIDLIIINLLSESLIQAIVFSVLAVLMQMCFWYGHLKNYESKNLHNSEPFS